MNVRQDVVFEQLSLQQQTQNLVDNLNATITAASKTVVAKTKQGVIPQKDGAEYHDKLVEAGKKLDKAKEFLALGDITNADVQYKAALLINDAVQTWLLQYTVKVPQ